MRQIAHGQHQRIALGRRGNDVKTILGVDSAQCFDRNVDGRCHLFEVHHARNHNRIGCHWHWRCGDLDAVQSVVVICVSGCNKGRYIASCFAWQVVVDVPERTTHTGTCDRLVDVTRTTVVCRQRQRPIAVGAVEVFEVFARRASRLQGVATFIDERIDLQAVSLARRINKLPQTHGRSARFCGRLQSRLDDWQGAQLDGQTCVDQLLLDHREVVL